MTITLLRDVTVVSERVTIRYSPHSVSEALMCRRPLIMQTAWLTVDLIE